ncbi:MAG: hypothetical protein U0237_20090 [Thermoleophilia bacterium]
MSACVGSQFGAGTLDQEEGPRGVEKNFFRNVRVQTVFVTIGVGLTIWFAGQHGLVTAHVCLGDAFCIWADDDGWNAEMADTAPPAFRARPH